MEARDLAEIEYCIPNIEMGRCVRYGPGVPEEWTVGSVDDDESVRIVVRVVEL